MRKSDLDLQKQELHVMVQLRRNRITGHLEIRELKTREGQRVIALPEGVVRVLEAHLANQDREREAAGDDWVESGFLFTTDHGAALDGDNILRTFQILIRKAGLLHLTMHDLRHANSSFMALLNVHPKVAQRQLGHSQISTTMDIYTHVADDSSREVAAKFNELLFQTAGDRVADTACQFNVPDADRVDLELQATMEGRSTTEIVFAALRLYLDSHLQARQAWAPRDLTRHHDPTADRGLVGQKLGVDSGVEAGGEGMSQALRAGGSELDFYIAAPRAALRTFEFRPRRDALRSVAPRTWSAWLRAGLFFLVSR